MRRKGGESDNANRRMARTELITMEGEGFYKRTIHKIVGDLRWGDFADELTSPNGKGHQGLREVMRRIP